MTDNSGCNFEFFFCVNWSYVLNSCHFIQRTFSVGYFFLEICSLLSNFVQMISASFAIFCSFIHCREFAAEKNTICCRCALLSQYFITHAGCIAAGVRIAFSCICLSVCPRSERKTAWAIDTKLCTRILYSSRLTCIEPHVKRSRSHGCTNRHGRTVASDACCYGRMLLLPAWVCMSIRLPMFSSVHLCWSEWQSEPVVKINDRDRAPVVSTDNHSSFWSWELGNQHGNQSRHTDSNQLKTKEWKLESFDEFSTFIGISTTTIIIIIFMPSSPDSVVLLPQYLINTLNSFDETLVTGPYWWTNRLDSGSQRSRSQQAVEVAKASTVKHLDFVCIKFSRFD